MLQQLIYWLLKDYDYKVEGLSSEENESLLNLLSSVDNTSFELAKMYITDKKEFKKPIFRLIESLRKPKKIKEENAGCCKIKNATIFVRYVEYENWGETYKCYRFYCHKGQIGYFTPNARDFRKLVALLKL